MPGPKSLVPLGMLGLLMVLARSSHTVIIVAKIGNGLQGHNIERELLEILPAVVGGNAFQGLFHTGYFVK